MSQAKLCKDCKHFEPGQIGGVDHDTIARCKAPQNLTTITSPVSGRQVEIPILEFAPNHRLLGNREGICGGEGRWFAPKYPVNVRSAFEEILRTVPVNRPQRPEIEKSIMAGSLDGYDLSDLVDAITAKAKDIAPDFEFDTASLKDALAAIEDNPKDHEAERFADPDDADVGFDLERRSA